MGPVRESDIRLRIEAEADDGPRLSARPAVEVDYLDGHMPARRCCDPGCGKAIDGAPLVSQGLPYHPECYLKSRRVILGVVA